jgi:tetratricopeptide (TPR) repeat protein
MNSPGWSGPALADRYTYIPLIGLFIIIVWGAAETADKWRKGLPAIVGGAVLVVAILAALTVSQIRYWQNSYNLFDHALTVVERNWLAHNNMGILLAQHGRLDEAIHHFEESVRINPAGATGFRNLGNAYQAAGRYSDAIEAFRRALRINPNEVEGHLQLGYAYLMIGNLDLAYQEYLQLKRLNEIYARPLLDSIQLIRARQ